jgi:tetratricopeptide (TPR) repeat protein
MVLLGCAVASPVWADTTRLDTIRLLRARNFVQLDDVVERAQAAADRDPTLEPPLVRILSAFETSDDSVTALVEEWVAARPSSSAARLARAEHHIALAWSSRGTASGDETSTTQFTDMQTRLQQVVRDVEANLKRHQLSGAPLAQLLTVAQALGGADACLRVWEEFRREASASFMLWNRLAHCLRPRWGGSYAALEELAGRATRHERANPNLRGLVGMVPFDQGTLAHERDRATAIRHYTWAIALGDRGVYRHWRARAYLAQRRFQEALVDIERALELVPEDADSLVIRAWIARDMGRTADASADVRLVAELDPSNDLLAQLRDAELDTAIPTARRLVNERAFAEAIDRLSAAIAMVGEDPEALFWRGRAKSTAGDAAAALPDLERALALDPRYFEALQGIDHILVARGQYQKAAQHWTDYLKLEPTNGKALLARAKAYIGRGDLEPGLADARAACRAGVSEGCVLEAEVKR